MGVRSDVRAASARCVSPRLRRPPRAVRADREARGSAPHRGRKASPRDFDRRATRLGHVANIAAHFRARLDPVRDVNWRRSVSTTIRLPLCDDASAPVRRLLARNNGSVGGDERNPTSAAHQRLLGVRSALPPVFSIRYNSGRPKRPAPRRRSSARWPFSGDDCIVYGPPCLPSTRSSLVSPSSCEPHMAALVGAVNLEKVRES